jgi:hypothetical protein
MQVVQVHGVRDIDDPGGEVVVQRGVGQPAVAALACLVERGA